MKIYTKTGDHGTTSLYKKVNGIIRVPKYDPRIKFVGMLDECIVSLGSCIAICNNHIFQNFYSKFFMNLINYFTGNQNNINYYNLSQMCENFQKDLMFINSNIASGIIEFPEDIMDRDCKKPVEIIEKLIDEIDEKLPKLTKFKLMGCNNLYISFNNCRVNIRKSERKLVEYLSKYPKEFPETEGTKYLLSYFNRLSDLMFILSRYVEENNIYGCPVWDSSDKMYW